MPTPESPNSFPIPSLNTLASIRLDGHILLFELMDTFCNFDDRTAQFYSNTRKRNTAI